MRILRLLAATAVIGVALSAGVAIAAESGERGATAPMVRWEDFDDLDFQPSQLVARDESSSNTEPGHSVELGTFVVDAEGQRGRIHRVIAGDTLWDISEAYLGTPWVWPSVWRENEGIANPHVIERGDRIWISSTEMRRITEREAEELLANSANNAKLANSAKATNDASHIANSAEESPAPVPASEAQAEAVVEALPQLTPGSSRAGSLSLAAKQSAPKSTATGVMLSVPRRESFGFVSEKKFQAASSIVGSPVTRAWLAGNDLVYLGLGEGEVELGQDFTVFRQAQEIRDVKRDSLIGYHVSVLGWLRVIEVMPEAAIARVMGSNAEIQRGDRIMLRDIAPKTIAIRRGQQMTVGQIVFMPADRSVMGMGDTVYIDRGRQSGLEIGSELEVFESGFNVRDWARRSTVHVPDEVVAKMVVVELQATTSVAYITHSRRELEVGDLFRTAVANDALASVR